MSWDWEGKDLIKRSVEVTSSTTSMEALPVRQTLILYD